MRYLEKASVKIGGVVFVAGFFKLNHLKTREEKEIAEPWQTIKIETNEVRSKIKESFAIFSDDDPDVDFEEKEKFVNRLGSKIIIEHNKGHFTTDDGVTELPSVLNALLEISK